MVSENDETSTWEDLKSGTTPWSELMRQMVMASMEPQVTPQDAALALDSDWPVEIGEYLLGNPMAPVAVSTLASPELASELLKVIGQESVAIVGKTETENIGVEKVVRNIVSNAYIRFLVVCGYDSLNMYPGQTLVCLSMSGVDANHRVIGSKGKKPLLVNLSPGEVKRFRKQVEVVDLVGSQDMNRIVAAVYDAASRYPGAYDRAIKLKRIPRIEARLPEKTKLDPSGYFVIYLDRSRGLLVMEHFENKGKMTKIIEGNDATSVYSTAIEMNLVSKLDHAAYLGRELTRAELCLKQGGEYIQDAAPESESDIAGHKKRKPQPNNLAKRKRGRMGPRDPAISE